MRWGVGVLGDRVGEGGGGDGGVAGAGFGAGGFGGGGAGSVLNCRNSRSSSVAKALVQLSKASGSHRAQRGSTLEDRNC